MSTRFKELSATARLAFPLAIAQVGMQFMGLVDTAMLGRYSDSALAAAGIANSLLFTVMVLGMGTVMGMDSLVPQAVGANEKSRARQLLWAGMRVGVLIGVPLTVVAGLSPLLLPLAGVDPALTDEAVEYVMWRLPAFIPFMVYQAMRSYLQAYNVTRPIIVTMVVGNIVNVIADVLLIYGDDGLAALHLPRVGLPALGVTGAALATSIVSVLITAVLLVSVRGLHREQGPTSIKPGERVTGLARTIFNKGFPVGLQLVAEVGIFALTAVLAGRLGKTPAAAHQVAIMLASFTFSLVVGIGAATSVRVGQAVGAGDTPAARRAGVIGLWFGCACMSIAGVCFVVMPGFLAKMFTNDVSVVTAAIPLLLVAAVFQLSDGIQAVAAGALRGAGDTKSPLIANVAGHYAIGLPVSITLAFGYDMGATGLWWGLSSGLTAVAIVLIWRFLHVSSKPIARS